MEGIVDRILELSRDFKSDTAFLEACEINNHSYLTDLKKGRNKNPGSDVLVKVIRGTGCSPSWLLTGEGPKYEKLPEGEKVSTNSLIRRALELVEQLEAHKYEHSNEEIPPEIYLKMISLLTSILKHEHKYKE